MKKNRPSMMQYPTTHYRLQKRQTELIRGLLHKGEQKAFSVIEDEENMVYLLRKAFLRHKCNLFVALDGDQAMAMYQNHKDDIGVVLLDIGLPKYSGWDIVLRIKTQNPAIKIFVTSGYLEPDIKSKMERAGVEAFIQKPYNAGDVVEMLCNSLEESVQR